VALEQLGAFVEALTREKYPDAVVHMGIFGANANILTQKGRTLWLPM
jgi:hypothetical protein